MSDPVTRDFADATLRELDRLHKWSEEQERRIRANEKKVFAMWLIFGGLWALSLVIVGALLG